jgi:hypothetical protein
MGSRERRYHAFWTDFIEQDLRIHDLRHTCASILIAQGEHPKMIQHHLGHSSITVTLDRYGHLFPSDVDAMADRLDKTFLSTQSDQRATRADPVPAEQPERGLRPGLSGVGRGGLEPPTDGL